MSGRTTWRLTPEQLCLLELLRGGHLAPLQSFMTPGQGADVATTGTTLGIRWPFALPLEVAASAVPAEGDDLALLDPEGVELASLTAPAAQATDEPGRLTVWGPLVHRTHVEPADAPELHLDSAALRALARGGTALVTSTIPTTDVEAALDGLLASTGTHIVVLLPVPADLGDRWLATVLAWQATLATRSAIGLCLLRTGGDAERGRALAVLAAGVAGCTAVALPAGEVDETEHDRLGALARARGLDVRTAGRSVAATDLATSGAKAHRDRYGELVWPYLQQAYPAPGEQGLTLMFSGLSGSGKSTVARAVAARLRLAGPRRVTLLDGDEVRAHLTSGLGFSAEDRHTNVQRIAWVAALVTRYGGAAICAPIAPYEAMRSQARSMVTEHGAFVLVHISTSLEECERRDRKGLYAKARRGEIPAFTGISDPYEAPTDADVTIDTAEVPVEDAVERVLDHLQSRGILPA